MAAGPHETLWGSGMSEPIERLEAAIKGRPVVSNAYAEVLSEDIISVCDSIPEAARDQRVKDLRLGSERAKKGFPVNISTRDIKFLIEMAG